MKFRTQTVETYVGALPLYRIAIWEGLYTKEELINVAYAQSRGASHLQHEVLYTQVLYNGIS